MDNGYTEAYALQSILNQHFHTVRPNLLLDRPMLGRGDSDSSGDLLLYRVPGDRRVLVDRFPANAEFTGKHSLLLP
jgi:hypothetical protein